METNTYTILAEKRNEVEKKLNRLQKKADKYNVPLSVSFGESYVTEITHRNEDGKNVVHKYEVVDLTIESETIKNGDYTIVAHLEHSQTGNIVNVFNGKMQTAWATVAPYCEHCHSNHNLKVTFMVSNGNEIKQVGRTCLKDYCGIDPQIVGMVNQFVDEIDEFTPEGYDFRESLPCVFDAVEVLALAIEITKEQGYIKSGERGSNKNELIKRVGTQHPTKEARKKAEEMEKAIISMDIDDAIDARLNNVQARLKGLFCKPSDFGYFAYAPTAFDKYLKRIAEFTRREAEKKTMGAHSEYVGTIGERTTFTVKEAKLLTTLYNEFGESHLYRFIDSNDNVLIWFASNTIDTDHTAVIKGTIKAHNEREGVKQTILTRVKVEKLSA